MAAYQRVAAGLTGCHLWQAASLLARVANTSPIRLTPRLAPLPSLNGLATPRPLPVALRCRVVHGGGRSALATNRPTGAVGNSSRRLRTAENRPQILRRNRIFKRHRTPQERAGNGSRPGPQRAEVRKSGRTQRAVRASAGSGLASWQVLERSRLAGWAPGLRVDPDIGHGLPTQRAAPPRRQGARSPQR